MSDLTLSRLASMGGQLETFTICPTHGSITGFYDDVEGQRWQTCDCHPDRRTEWPQAYDLPMRADLCRTCGAALLRSGSRWSLFHCQPCKDFWWERMQADLLIPPLGRHSIMNRVPVDPTDPDVVGGIKRMAASIEALGEWRAGLVRKVIDEETSLVDYLERVEPSPPEAWLEHQG